MKIVVLDGYTVNPGDLNWDELKTMGELTVYDRTDPGDVLERICDAEIVYTNKVVLSGETLRKCGKLRYIGVLATGYNVVDVAVADELGITVTNIPGYSTDSVAQFVFAFLLDRACRVADYNRIVKAGEWQRSPYFTLSNFPIFELYGKTMGIIGLGTIGKKVAQIAQAFGMKVLANRRHPDLSLESETLHFTDLDTLLQNSDVISIHCPLTEQTRNLIGRETIEKMKDGAILINTSRGPVVNEVDVAEALKTGKLSAAAVDVLPTEPPVSGSPLIDSENCLVTPHIGWAPLETRKRLMRITLENLQAYLNGTPKNAVHAK